MLKIKSCNKTKNYLSCVMLISEVLLILISGLGALHGSLIALYLCGQARMRTTPNILLSLLLFVLSFRIGKSVILEFAVNVDYLVIFTGLSTLLLIGPLFYLFTRSVLNSSFRLNTATFLHFTPFIPAFVFGLLVNRPLILQIPIPVFVIMFGLYYGHYLLYLLLSYKKISESCKKDGNTHSVKWLRLLFYGLIAIWIVYVINLLEDRVPYIIGPVLYSVIAYGITFMAIRNKYVSEASQPKYRTTPLNENESGLLYEQIKALVAGQELFKDAGLSLNTLSKILKVSPQKISMAINLNSQSNFNGFINRFRISNAEFLLKNKEYQNYTIAFIAFETGFTTLSTFNSAFKKETGKTPSLYRKEFAESSELLL